MSLRFLQQRACALMGVGREGRGSRTPLDFEIFSKKGCFHFTTFNPPGKILEKSPSAPPRKKSFRRPCAHSTRFGVLFGHNYAYHNLVQFGQNGPITRPALQTPPAL